MILMGGGDDADEDRYMDGAQMQKAINCTAPSSVRYIDTKHKWAWGAYIRTCTYIHIYIQSASNRGLLVEEINSWIFKEFCPRPR